MTIDETGIIERREPYEQPAVIRLPVVSNLQRILTAT